jgi:hypothetical protein
MILVFLTRLAQVILVLQVLVGCGFSDSIDKLNWKPVNQETADLY